MRKYDAFDAIKDTDTYLRAEFGLIRLPPKMPPDTNCLTDDGEGFAHSPFCAGPVQPRLCRIPVEEDMHGYRIDLRQEYYREKLDDTQR